jgi:hypothetical protein
MYEHSTTKVAASHDTVDVLLAVCRELHKDAAHWYAVGNERYAERLLAVETMVHKAKDNVVMASRMAAS